MKQIPSELVADLKGRYELRDVVGRGGMATVYRADDMKHRREVAIKVLKPELSANLGAERFLREIEIAAQLQHPHILMLIDSGQASDTFYYVMPLVEGGSLRTQIEKGNFDIDRVISITRKVADALEYAHQQGVVHRDIKPENILFSRGYPVVGDFGIAKAISTAGVSSLTRTGFPLGTVGYMSPEQAAGSTDLGPTTDVYGLACVTYEMIVGAVPGIWLSDADSDEGLLRDIPSAHRTRIDACPKHVEPALARALARRPSDRFESPAEFVAALKGEKKVKRRYAENQVSAIIKHAAESQFANPTTEGNLTVGAIEAIATDVGLSPQRVHEAIIDLDSSANAPVLQGGLYSMPSSIEMEATIAGEVPPEEFGALLEEIRLNLREVGRVNETMGRSLSWNSASYQNSMGGTGRLIHITVSPKRGETKLSITESAGVHHGMLVIGSLVGGSMLTAMISEVIVGGGMGLIGGLSIGAITISSTYTLGRIGLRRYLKHRYEQLGGLLRKMSNVSREIVGTHTTD